MKKKFLIFSGLKILNMGLIIFTLGIISQKLNVDLFGQYSLIQSFIGIIIGFLFSWSSSLILFFGIKEKSLNGNMRETIEIRNKLLFKINVILILVFVFYNRKIEEYLGISTFYIYIIIILKVLNDYLIIYLLSIKKKIESALLQFSLRVLMGVYVIFNKFSLKEIILMTIFVELCGVVFVMFVDKKDFKKFVDTNTKIKLEIKEFLIWQFIGFLGLSLTNYGDNFIIKSLYTFEDIGIYNRAYTIFLGMDSVIGILTSYLNPEIISAIAKKDLKFLNRYLKKDRYAIFIIFLLINLFFMYLSPIFFKLIYSNNIDETIKIFKILSLGNIVRVWAYLYNCFYNTTNNFKYLQKINILRGIMNVTLSYFLIKELGIIGAAYATLLTLTITTTIMTIKGESLIKINFFQKNQNI
ncbi:lipopolysaccharide biosynthesis protein [Cetobacterium somerae]